MADIGEFEKMGVKIRKGPNIEMLKTIVTGDATFASQWCESKSKKLDNVMQAIADLPKAHTALHLLRTCGSTCKVVHLARSTPRSLVDPLLKRFDAQQRRALETIAEFGITDDQWVQAQLPAMGKEDVPKGHAASGMGLRCSSLTASDA